MNVKLLAAILYFISNIKICQGRKYDNFTLYRVVPVEAHHLTFLRNLENQKYIDVIFWKKPVKLYYDVEFIINPSDVTLFTERAAHFKIRYQILTHNIQSEFDDQTIQVYHRLQADDFRWERYHTLGDINQWLSDLVLQFPNISDTYVIGKSAEGRDIWAISIKRPTATHKVIIEGTIHGCEWISAEFVTYLAYQLLHADIRKRTKLSLVAAKYHWLLIPIVNPDGFDYSHRVDRLWKKNRRNIGGNIGVNLNRNFDLSFGRYGASTNPSDEDYAGPFAFSEPESKALSKFINQHSNSLKFYFAFHGFGQKIVIPFADRVNHIEDFSEMENYGKQAILKIYNYNGVKYSVGTFYDTLGMRLSGNSASWVKKHYKVKYVYTFLLRDNGTYGHALPPNQIIPACKETMIGLIQIMTARFKRVRSNLFDSSPDRKPLNLYLFLILAFFEINIFG